MTHKVKRGLISIVMAAALVISVLTGVLPLQSIKVGAETVPEYLTFTAEQDNSSVTLNLYSGLLEYSKGDDAWAAYTSGTEVPLSYGETVRFRGDSNSDKQLFDCDNTVTISSRVACSGNIMTLLDYNDPDNATMAANCFSYMFKDCTGLTSAPALSATTLANYCYNSMFSGCTGLTSAPELPATTLAANCYSNMFNGCIGLTSAPELPATTLAANCYSNMFNGCAKLTSAPELPATTLANYCYNWMFYGCTGLTSAPELPATTLANYCYNWMFYGCTGLTSAPALSATTLADYCYYSMFTGCTGLTSAPALTATTLTKGCYAYMFQGCTSLTEPPVLPATTLANYCYSGMFYGCTGLTEAPELPATTLEGYCYQQMFMGCTGLTEPVELPATTLSRSCYNKMFSGCTGIKLLETKTEHYNTEYRIPASGEGTTASDALTEMFASTGGLFKGTPSINKIYYLYKEAAVTYTKVEAKSATYEEAGNSEYYIGSDGKFYKSEDDGATFIEIEENSWIIPKLEVPDDTDYLTFTAEEDNSSVMLSLWTGTLEYSVNNVEWAAYTSNTSVALKNGETVRFRGGSNNDKQLFSYFSKVTINGKVACSGNIMTLVDYNDPDNATMGDSCFYRMFYGCTGLTSAPKLPATTLKYRCYEDMFNGCTGLTEPPALPATDLAAYCYSNMFNGCTGLTSAPALPATALADNCYNSMFSRCTGLTSAPELPATSLANSCYSNMFYGCTGLTEPPALPATTLADYCYWYMFWDCTGLTSTPELPATTLADYCYSRMFLGCTGLIEPPELPATTLADNCYIQMFSGCTGIKLSKTQNEEYNTAYRIPSTGTGTTPVPSGALSNMFTSTGGPFTGTPSINTIYYIHKDVTYTPVPAKPATYEADGNIAYYKGSDGKFYKSEDDGDTFIEIEENSWVIPKLTPLMQVDTDSSNGVDVNICAPLPEGEDINDYSIKFGDTVQPFSDCSKVEINEKTYYLVKVTCPAKNMADKYAYAVQKNGTAQAGASGEVSVRDYADTVIGGKIYDDSVKKICRAMLAYGTAAQTYFGHNITDLANSNNSTGEGSDYSAVTVPKSVFDKTSLNEALAEAPVEYAGMSLTLKHDTYISIAFKVKDGTQDAAVTYVNEHFNLEGVKVSAEKNGTSFVVIRADAVSINNLMNSITLTFDGTDYTVNAGQYMYWAVTSSGDDNLANVCKALYNYYSCVTSN